MRTSKSVIEISKAIDVVGWYGVLGASKYLISENGDIMSMHKKKPRLLKPGLAGYGYKQITMVMDDGSHKHTYVHDLVAEIFWGPKPKGYCVRHIDGDCVNNSFDNIVYGTYKENMADMRRHGKTAIGVKNPCAKLNPEKAEEIRRLVEGGRKQNSVAKEYGVSNMAISRVVNRECWR